VLAVLLVTVAADGLARVSWDFLNSYPSRFADRAGIKAALYGSLWMMAFTALFAIPIGIGAAIYLEEFAPRNWLTKAIETNINNLAGVPSIIYGLLGLAIFVRGLDLGRTVIAGSLTMSLLVLPIIIVASREGLRAVPPSIRSQFTVLPIQIFNWVSRPQAEFQTTAAAGIVVLMTMLLTMNAIAIGLRNYFERKRKW
jgi:phosphate transport system permease protein